MTVTNDCGSLNSQTATITVVDPPTVPANFTATMQTTTSIRLQWTPSTSAVGIAGYRIERLLDGAQWTTGINPTFDNGLVPGRTYIYRVRAIDNNGAESEPSAANLATLVTFEDDPVVAGQTIIRGIHIGDLRRAVDTVRSAANLAPAWTNYNAETGVVLASHFITLRDRLNEALILLQLPTVELNPSQPVAIGSLIRAEHVQILRGGVQ